MSKWFRNPHTSNEMRQYYAALCEDPDVRPKIRARRKPVHLPTAWDDISVSRSRSWKRHRKHNWKPKRCGV